ncbi:MAG: TonB-dependent receptor [Nitrospirales bacterium]|nr:TonB-dependent receptor [Nitrospira sp.]MDR4500530.1 TonB-dependent receptor [Nitrospirales bacterium]
MLQSPCLERRAPATNWFVAYVRTGARISISCLVLLCSGLVLPSAVGGESFESPEETEIPIEDFTQLSLEELMGIEITSVSKKKEKLSGAAAAVFVITQEDIRRSGVTSIPEALRMVPGMHVARLDNNKWAVSARGFNGRFSNKMLVLIDGRNVYNPFFAGTVWEVNDTLLEDIDRIEVIRGPGGTLWGVNAVNGVINIMTKSAKTTQGGLVSALGGSEEAIGGVRYGGQLGNDLHYRLFAKGLNRDTAFIQGGAHDDWRVVRGGFRSDWDINVDNRLMAEGGIYRGNAGQRVVLPTLVAPSFSQVRDEDVEMAGGHILLRWARTFSQDSDMELQFFYDRFYRKESAIKTTIDTLDLDFQHRFALPYAQDIVWGLGYRIWFDDFGRRFTVAPIPRSKTLNLINAFVQDEITAFNDEVSITFGTKVSHNDFTGFEFQPSGRVLWQPVPEHAWWVAVSRAVRVPSRAADHGAVVQPPNPPALPVPLNLTGNQQLGVESLVAFEVGYRLSPIQEATLDITAFYNLYDNLLATKRVAVTPLPTFQFVNNKEARTHGVEVAANLQVLKSWQIRGAYTYLNLDVDTEAGALGLPDTDEKGSPSHQVSIRSLMSLPHNVELDSWVRYVDALPSLSIPGYWELDLRLGWKPWKKLEVALVGQNLLDKHHPEMAPSFLQTQATEVQRSIYGKVTWSF